MSKIQLLVGSLHKLLVVDSIEDIDFEQLCEIAQKLKVEITVCSSFEFDSVIMMQAIFKFISKLRRHIKGSENFCMENCKLATIKRSCIRLCQGDENTSASIYDELTSIPDMVALASLLSSRHLLAMLFAIMHSCVLKASNISCIGSSQITYPKLDNLLTDRPYVLRSLLLAIVDIPLTEGENDPALEWSHIFMFKILQYGAFRKLFQSVGPTFKSQSKLVTHEQLIAIYIGLCIFEDSYCATELGAQYSANSQLDPELMTLMLDLISIINEAEESQGESIYQGTEPSWIGRGDDIDIAIEKIDRKMNSSLQFDFVSLSLQFIGAVLAILPATGWGLEARERLTADTRIIEICCKGVLAKRNPLNANNKLEVEVKERRNAAVQGALQLLTNLLHGCQSAQDLLRESGGLTILLSNCFTDFENPFAREWALMCVRNACLGNESNQAFVDQLKPQSSHQSLAEQS